jgi:hypothetical protein
LLLPSLLMLFAVGTERLETTRMGAGTVREEDVKVFLDRVQRVQLTRGDHLDSTRTSTSNTATPPRST